MNQMLADYESDQYEAVDYIAVFKRRKWFFIVPWIVLSIVALAVTFLLPANYTSDATILIEEQEVPRDFVTSTITSFAAQQIQVISQRVLTASSIARISDKFGLFVDPDTGRRPPVTQIAETFREDMELDLVSADVIDPRSGRAQQATIAFTLAFTHPSPSTAQKVTNELVTLFLDENLRTRTERVANTEAFLSAQAERLNNELTQIESDIAEFKRLNGAALPEMYQNNLGNLERRTAELGDVDSRLREIIRQKLDVTGEMQQLNPWGSSVAAADGQLLSKSEQIAAIQAELSQLRSIYQDKHPDVVNLQKRLTELEAENEKQIGQQEGKPEDTAQTPPTNPTYLLLQRQLDALLSQENELLTKRQELKDRVEYYETLLARSPSVEKDYKGLLRDYQSVQLRYQDVRAKERSAEIAETMEEERKGERFLLVEPPSLPSEPSSPNRPAIALVGLILSIAAGVGLVFLLELLDKSIYEEQGITQIVGVPPFAVVGYIETEAEISAAKRIRNRAIFIASGSALAGLLFFHFFIKPIDVAWLILLSRLGF